MRKLSSLDERGKYYLVNLVEIDGVFNLSNDINYAMRNDDRDDVSLVNSDKERSVNNDFSKNDQTKYPKTKKKVAFRPFLSMRKAQADSPESRTNLANLKSNSKEQEFMLSADLLNKLEEQGLEPTPIESKLPDPSYLEEMMEYQEFEENEIEANQKFLEKKYLSQDFLSNNIEPQRAKLTEGFSLRFEHVVNKILMEKEIDYKWYFYVHSFINRIINTIKPNLNRPNEVVNYNEYVNVLCVKWKNHLKCEYVHGMVLDNKIADRHMKMNILDPKIVLVSGELSLDVVKRSFLDIETILKQEKQYLRSIEKNLLAVKPDIIVVEKVNSDILTINPIFRKSVVK
jgi:hypothetical protein